MIEIWKKTFPADRWNRLVNDVKSAEDWELFHEFTDVAPIHEAILSLRGKGIYPEKLEANITHGGNNPFGVIRFYCPKKTIELFMVFDVPDDPDKKKAPYWVLREAMILPGKPANTGIALNRA